MLTKQRQNGETDPLLIVVGSQKHFLDSNNLVKMFDKQLYQTAEENAQKQLEYWYQQLPHGALELRDLSLPLELSPFKPEDTRDYLQKLSDKLVADDQKVEAIHRVTQGYPIYVELAAAAVLRAQARGQELSLDEILNAPVPQTPGTVAVSDMHIGDYLLSLFMKQLPESEQMDLIFCAVPRELDIATLSVVLELSSVEMEIRSSLS